MKNIIRKIAITASAFLFVCQALSAQTAVKGTVRDAKGEAVAGAVVMLSGNSTVASVTDLDGNYSLTIPKNAKNPVLSVSCLSYKTQDIEVLSKSVIDIVLQDDTQELEEVVVIGYGSMRKSDLTGSVSSVRIDENVAAQSSSLDQLLQGHAAGVSVVNDNAGPDAGVSVRVRGMSSFHGNNEPLYVIDGVILNNPTTRESVLTVGTDNEGNDESVNGLMGLSPQDIAGIEILKDASATAIYGALGANGVVLITTKTASKDRPTINFSAGVDVSTRYKKMPILNFDEYVTFLEKQLAAGIDVSGFLSQIYEDPATRSGLKVTPMDWQDYTFRTAVSQRYHLSISGRPKSLSYAFSLNYNDKQGIVKETGVKSLSLRLNLDKNFGKIVKVGTKTNLAYVDSKQGQSAGRATSATSLIRSILSTRPYKSVNPNEEPEEEEDDNNTKSSPDRWLTDFVNNRKEFRVTPSIYAQVKIIDGLTFKSTLGGDLRDSERIKFKSSRINSTSEGSAGAIANYKYFNWNWDNTLSWKFQKKDHHLNAMLGTSANSSSVNSQIVQGWNVVQYKGLEKSIQSAPNSSLSYNESLSTTLSFFARAVYNWKDRYVLTGTYRIDGSSKFQGANKWSRFPSLAFAWRMSEEPWFGNSVISQTKIRLGWGRVGNQAISSYQTMSNFKSTTYSDHNPSNPAAYSVGLVPENIANPGLKWETTEQANLGLDMSFWNGRLAFNLDAYNKVTYDLLQQKRIATSSGFSTMWVNEGTVRNRGIELTLDSTPLKIGDFEWSLGGNISLNRNCIMSLSNSASSGPIFVTPEAQQNVVYFTGSSVGSSNYDNAALGIFMVGYEMGLFYGFKTDGIVQEGETAPPLENGGEPLGPGHLRMVDLNGNGYIDNEDRTIIGNPNADFTYGFNTTISYKRLSLTASFNGSKGNDIFNVNKTRETDTMNKNHNVLREAVFDAWSPENTGAKYWAVGSISSTECRAVKDIDVEDGSYLRLANLSLNYNVPMKKTNKVLKGLNIGASAHNIAIWTKYSGWDPEVNSFGSNIMKMGADAGSYPSARTFSFDLKFTF